MPNKTDLNLPTRIKKPVTVCLQKCILHITYHKYYTQLNQTSHTNLSKDTMIKKEYTCSINDVSHPFSAFHRWPNTRQQLKHAFNAKLSHAHPSISPSHPPITEHLSQGGLFTPAVFICSCQSSTHFPLLHCWHSTGISVWIQKVDSYIQTPQCSC